MELSAVSDEKKITRREYYAAGAIATAEEDTNADGAVDKWETYRSGALATAAFDENFDGAPDRRLSYDGEALVTIETLPDASGRYTKRVAIR